MYHSVRTHGKYKPYCSDRWTTPQVIMSSQTMDTAFEKHVQDFLCSESYEFLKAVSAISLCCAFHLVQVSLLMAHTVRPYSVFPYSPHRFR